MIEINVNVRCPDLTHFVSALAGVLNRVPITEDKPTPAPVLIENPTPAPETAAPAAAGPAQTAPSPSDEAPTPEPVSPRYTQHAISMAGANLVRDKPDAMPKVQALLQSFGVVSTAELKPEALDSFAEKLIELGAKL